MPVDAMTIPATRSGVTVIPVTGSAVIGITDLTAITGVRR